MAIPYDTDFMSTHAAATSAPCMSVQLAAYHVAMCMTSNVNPNFMSSSRVQHHVVPGKHVSIMKVTRVV